MITCQGALTPTADPHIYRAQWLLRPFGDRRTEPGGMPQHLDTPVPYTLTITQLELRDEYYDFDEETREYTNHRNPHWNTGDYNTNNYTDEGLAILQERGEELPPPHATFCTYFWDAINPAEAVQIGFEKGDTVITLE